MRGSCHCCSTPYSQAPSTSLVGAALRRKYSAWARLVKKRRGWPWRRALMYSRQVGQMRGGQLQLAAQEVPRLAEVVRGRVQQTLVQRADVGLIGLVLGQSLHGRILCGGYLFRAACRGKIQGKSEVAGDRG